MRMPHNRMPRSAGRHHPAPWTRSPCFGYCSGMGGKVWPRIETVGDRTRFLDRDGNRWTIYDTSFGPPHAPPGRYARFPHGDRRATARVFVPPDPASLRPTYEFRPDDSRELTVELLTKQMARCTWTSRAQFDASTWGVR